MNFEYRITKSESLGVAWKYFEVDIFTHDQYEKGINYVLKVLSDLSEKHELIADSENWQGISFNKAKFLLENGFRYDLAYTSCENDTEVNAKKHTSEILEKFVPLDTICLSNTSCNLWGKSSSWNSITNHTFDLGVLITDLRKITIVVFVGED